MRSPRRWAVALLAVLGVSSLAVLPAQAVTGLEGFDPEYLIADQVMDDSGTMTAAQIQAFLAAKGAACVVGTDGSPCLKNAAFDTPTRPATEFCGAYVGAAGEAASAVLARTSQACGINPQVLLVTLQKEQALVTTTNPTATMYDRAMGFRCPDGSACEVQYAGFANQVSAAASRLNEYRLHPERFTYRVGGTYDVKYHPTTSCGTKRLTLRTAATAALYNYTPYTPNAASLAAVAGLGDSCSSYGIRNFFRLFSLWFGQPNTVPLGTVVVHRWWQPRDGDWMGIPAGGAQPSDAQLLGYGYSKNPVPQFSAPVTATDSGMVAVHRWWNAVDRDWIDVADGSIPDATMARYGYTSKTLQYWVYTAPAAGRVAVYRWWGAADRDWITLRDGEIADASLTAWGYTGKALVGYARPAP